MVTLVGFTVIEIDNNEALESELFDDTLIENFELNPVNFSAVSLNELGTIKASWYGPGFHGRLTANGETYDQMSLTAAHKSMKFGTLLKVTNLRNNRSVVVRINDRGPYIHGRDLDLSKAAAMQLGLVRRGVGKMKIEELVVNDIQSPVISNSF